MPYSERLTEAVYKEPLTLGRQLGRLAIKLDFSILRISAATGATRQTVYNWFRDGADVSPAYQPRVKSLAQILKQSKTAEDAWRTACSTFDLRT